MEMRAEKRALDKIYKRRDRYEIPDWQRTEVWSRSKKQLFIDTILRDWKIPKFYFVKTSSDPDEYEVVDGQQRLITIFEFFDNELPLSKTSAKLFGAEYYKDLREKYSDHFDDFEIEFDEIYDADEKELKEFFQRLQEGLRLTSSEKLNSVHSKLRDFARHLAKHSFFKKKVSLSDKRYAYFDIVSKVATIEIEGIDTGLRYDDLKQTFESQASFSARSNVAKRLKDTFDYLDAVFPKQSSILKNRTIVQSLATFTAKIVNTQKQKGQEKKLRHFLEFFMLELSQQVQLGQNATDSDYIAFQKSVNANVRGSAKIRQQILLRKLLMFDPSFVEVFEPTVIAESALTKRVKRIADSIASLVSDINDDYSSDRGTDLFKATNKTTRALIRIGRLISNYTEYQRFINDLYFVFHEGTGTRLTGKKPASFIDVNLLRTGIQHDLDHGKRSKSVAKRRKIGATFKKYAGSVSPITLAPERFPIVHANILAALESDLRNLSW